MTRFPRIYIPARGPEDWRPFLGEPDKHWRVGYSARTLAYCWHDTSGFPESVGRVLQKRDEFAGIEMMLALPEHQVPLPPSGGRPSQTDLFVLARTGEGLLAITVEGKVDEPFGELVAEWKRRSPSPGKQERLVPRSPVLH